MHYYQRSLPVDAIDDQRIILTYTKAAGGGRLCFKKIRMKKSGMGSHQQTNTVPIVVVGVSPSWTSVVTIAVNRAGEADLQTIYSIVEQIAPDKCQNNPHYKEKIRQKLQYHFTRIAKGWYKK